MSSFFEQKIQAQMGGSGSGPLTRLSLGHLVSAVLSINNDADAKAFYDSYVAWLQAYVDDVHVPQKVACDNIGWCFGEGMSDERIAMWRRVTPAAHPVLPITENRHPTAQECFDAGRRLGKK